jgi:hypothetical protein
LYGAHERHEKRRLGGVAAASDHDGPGFHKIVAHIALITFSHQKYPACSKNGHSLAMESLTLFYGSAGTGVAAVGTQRVAMLGSI